MKTDERDELLRRQVDAAESLAQFSMRFAQTVEAPERRRRDSELRVAYPPLRRPFHGEHGLALFARAIPGFAALWEKTVPDSHVLLVAGRDNVAYRVVLCVCGHQTPLQEGQMSECAGLRWTDVDMDPSGPCTRFFLSTRENIRVHAFPTS